MAKLSGGMDLRGTIHRITFYKLKGLDDIIARAAAGPTREVIDKNPNYKGLKERNSEFSGKSKCASAVNKVLAPLHLVGDFSRSGPLTGLLTPAIKADTMNEPGRRSVLLSSVPFVLPGFNLNKRNSFDTVLTHPLECTVSRQQGKVSVTLPAILPGINFHSIGTFSHFQVILSAGIVPDFYYVGEKDYRTKYAPWASFPVTYYGDWRNVAETTETVAVDLTLPYQPAGNDYSIVVAAGISFGLYRTGGQYDPIKGAGCGKIIGVF